MEPRIRPVLWSITILNCCWLEATGWLVLVVTLPRLDTVSVTCICSELHSVAPPVSYVLIFRVAPFLAISSSLAIVSV